MSHRITEKVACGLMVIFLIIVLRIMDKYGDN